MTVKFVQHHQEDVREEASVMMYKSYRDKRLMYEDNEYMSAS